MKRVLLVSLLCLWPMGAHTEPPLRSLFFTEEDVHAIEAEIAAHPQNFIFRNQKRIHLDSLLYYGPGRWTVWLQGEKWTPETQKPTLEILEVTPETVFLRLLPPLVNEPKDVSLRPYQSFDLTTQKIVEGR